MQLAAQTAARLDSLPVSDRPILIGLSGGADSRALLIVASRWARLKGREVHALVADHAFRDDSAAEARRASAMAEAESVPARIIRRTGLRPATGVQAAARSFRLTALAEEARRIGADTILLGHNADDRSETVWMRVSHGAQASGLAAMPFTAPHPLWPVGQGLTIARPLIDQSRAAVRSWLKQQGLDWIDDPSNEDPAYTRIRVRRTVSAIRERGFDPQRLAALSEDAGAVEDALSNTAARHFAALVELTGWGGARMAASLTDLPDQIFHRVLAAAIAAVSGRPLPSPQAVDAIGLGLKSGAAATGGGAALTYWQGAAWLVREPGRTPPAAIALKAGQSSVFDGRFEVSAGEKPVSVAPLGSDYTHFPRRDCLDQLPGLARPTLPAMRRDGTELAVAGLDEITGAGMKPLAAELAARSLFAGHAPAWFDSALRTETLRSRNLSSKPPYPGRLDLEPVRT